MDNSKIQNILNKCWFDATGLHIEPIDLDELPLHDDLYIASVVFTGESQGSLTLAMSETMAKTIAGRMFDSSIDSVTFDDIRDSIGELANVLAGNMKTDFFGRSELSRPVVFQGSDSMLSTFIIDAIFQKVFVCGDMDRLLIQVCQVD